MLRAVAFRLWSVNSSRLLTDLLVLSVLCGLQVADVLLERPSLDEDARIHCSDAHELCDQREPPLDAREVVQDRDTDDSIEARAQERQFHSIATEGLVGRLARDFKQRERAIASDGESAGN